MTNIYGPAGKYGKAETRIAEAYNTLSVAYREYAQTVLEEEGISGMDEIAALINKSRAYLSKAEKLHGRVHGYMR